LYFIGLSSMPQLVIDGDFIYLVYSSATETYDNGLKNYRKIFGRQSYNGGNTWGSFKHFTSDIVHNFDECVYPACAANTNDYFYFSYQYDVEPGTAVWAAQHPYVDNNIAVVQEEIGWTGTNEYLKTTPELEVSQNYPNPVTGKTYIQVTMQENAVLDFSVTNLCGQIVQEIKKINFISDETTLTIDASELSSGVYFYTVSDGNKRLTKKMIVE